MKERAYGQQKGRNFALDLLKLAFAVRIAIHHYGINTFLSSEIVVMSFFIISGFYLLESFDSGKYEDAWQYSKNRIKKIYPLYIIAFVMLFVFEYRNDLAHLVMNLFTSLPEVFMVQYSGAYDCALNKPLWFLGTMLIASHILFGLLSYNRGLTVNVIAPIGALLSFTYMANIFKTHTVDEFGIIYGMIYVPMFRAFGALVAGISANIIVKDGKKVFDKMSFWVENIVGVIFLYAFVIKGNKITALVPLIIVMMYFLSEKCIINIIINRLFNTINITNKWYFVSFDQLSLSVYFFHLATIRMSYYIQCLSGIESHSPIGFFIFVLVTMSVSYLIPLLINNILRGGEQALIGEIEASFDLFQNCQRRVNINAV